ncbi:MAG TPA: DNA translocase FtsK 4TM domain-containing protein [Bdellovibrionales bacterium]|nr:DNA translocase FtsK 4TM domain-containing protein [Bdellovibrionales bacterium]
MAALIQRFRRDIVIIGWFALAVFVGLSLASYDPTDPSFNSTGTGTAARNFCGYIGSFLADLLFQAFGLTAWFFSVAAFFAAYRTFGGKPIRSRTQRVVLGTILLVVLSSLIALYLPEKKIFSKQIYVGGFVGLAVSKQMALAFNKMGAGIIFWSLLLILVVFFTERPLDELVPREGLNKIGAAVRGWLKTFWSELTKRQPKPAPIERAVKPQAEVSAKLSLVKAPEPVEFSDEVDGEADRGDEPDMIEEGAQQKFKFALIQKKEAEPKPKKIAPKVQRRIENWELPKLSLLQDPPATRVKIDERAIRDTTFMLEDKLSQFDVNGKVTAVKPGPAVTMFEFKPNADVKISKITDLADDLALALSSESIRIIAPVPGRDVVGIETSNPIREKVYLKDNLTDSLFWDDKIKLPVVLGKQANGDAKVVDLRKMPHLMVAGTTGSGKSVFVVSLLTGLLFRHSPKTLRLILIDPKQVDLAAFQNLPHLLMPPIQDPKKAVNSLKWAIGEMEKRYRSMSRFGARGLEEFNQVASGLSKTQVEECTKENEELELTSKSRTYYFSPQPYIVVVVEEFGDLMAVDKFNVENCVVRLAQMARACGIHLVLAMQSPRRDVVTGLIKTNIPGRISFKVASKMDSRIILDESGAERLLATGDMLFLAPGVAKPERHHGAWLSEDEINQVAQFWSAQAEPQYDMNAVKALDQMGGEGVEGGEEEGLSPETEERYDEILAYVSELTEVSASLLQRKFRLGYPRAARMIEIFEKEGVVGPANGSKPRQVLINKLG